MSNAALLEALRHMRGAVRKARVTKRDDDDSPASASADPIEAIEAEDPEEEQFQDPNDTGGDMMTKAASPGWQDGPIGREPESTTLHKFTPRRMPPPTKNEPDIPPIKRGRGRPSRG